MHSGIQFSVLGPVRLHKQGVEEAAGQPRQCAVLASLLLRAGRPVSLSTLVEDVWGDEAPPSAVGSVRTYVYRLRQALSEQSDSSVRLVDGGYLLRIRPDDLDLNRFKQTMAEARKARNCGDLALAADLLSQSLGMWNGVALAGVPGPFAGMQRGVLGELRLACAEEQLACEVERGRYAEAAAELSALLVEHPLRERVCGLLMTALYGAGRQSEALTIYHTTSHLLRQRLGVNPSPELQQVHERILSGRFQLPKNTNRPITGRHPASPQAPAQLPAALPSLVGREKEQEQLERLADDAEASSSVAICVIGGMAGVGKTAFATTIAHRLAERFPDGQLFADLHGAGPGAEPRNPAEVLADFLQSLGVRPEAIPETSHARGLMFRGLLAKRRMLVVLDNAWSTEQLKDLLPGAPGSMAIVTSRMQLHALVAGFQALPLTLLPLSQADARSFLARRLGAARTAAEPEAVDRIIESAGRHPLALANVAARAAYRPQMHLASLADEYTASEHSILDAFTSDEDPVLDVRASIARSYHMLDPESASLFRALSAWPGAMFAASDAANMAAQPEQQVRQTLPRLIHAHLISEVGPGRYNWNQLLTAFAGRMRRACQGSGEG
ncbi:winged helix-turn-helix domain-containing protein [Streptomyces sp. MC1]|uniref:AfsR/SARP family transcriptional regulator n=3 Tax=Streptomyces TaxID=1883 RepID=UPI0018C9B1D4|nr:BTAD domain-containing putative transcriptional regulator [Streptomyces sp. MC1]MBG7697572.1 winged helix-turn-helix domain-containing protein [Streptomyces sp. MC1]